MKIYILEDEINIMKYIISIVDKIPHCEIVGYSDEIAIAKTDIPRLNPDVVLADIELKDGDSFTLFSSMEKIDFQILFVTAFNEFAIKALNIGAVGYLLKPIDENEFKEQLNKCFKKNQEYKVFENQISISKQQYHLENEIAPKLILKCSDFIQIVEMKDIMYCKSDKGYTTFYFQDGSSTMVSKVLKEYESIMPSQTFLRCHQSFLINVNFMKKYFREGILQMKDGYKIPVSDRKKAELMNYFQ
ncbi:LytR/AlgR family response regulator transcription factor [Chryseobacterium terrae]|uniref:LytTR family DNA-binding domain-containing protein n=1 Tax=Chryseobacterium terrae TaxID=3163299 RepID=A0ABW8Y855_9FLAO